MKPVPADEATEPTPYRYHRWRDTVIRDRRVRDVEALTTRGWAYTPYALDALTGMGEDPYSCGEWADEVTEAEAAKIAEARGLSLTMEPADATDEPQRVPGRPVPAPVRRWLPGWAWRRLFGR